MSESLYCTVPKPKDIQHKGVRMGFRQGRPVLMVGKEAFWTLVYTFDPYQDRPYLRALESMYRQGVRLFSFLLPLATTWTPDGYDFTLIDELHHKIFDLAPEALFIPRVFMTTPDWWDDKYPKELIRFADPVPEPAPIYPQAEPLWRYETKHFHGLKNASLASKQWLTDAADALAAYVKHTWQGSHAGRIIGYHIAYGTCGEWGHFGRYAHNLFGCYDFSDPMVESFRTMLGEKYSSDEALQHAWQKPNVTLDTALPPDKITILKTDVGVFKDPRRCIHYTDWVDHYCRQTHNAMVTFARAAKSAAPVDVLTGVFGSSILQVGAAECIAQECRPEITALIDSPEIDFLATPNNYEFRSDGVFSQAPTATIARKKLFFTECDVRTYQPNVHNHPKYGPSNEEQTIPFFKRDIFYSLTQGSGHCWLYDFGCGWYLEERYEKIVRTLIAALADLDPTERIAPAEIAYVLDHTAPCYVEGHNGYYRLTRECLNREMPRLGAPFDIITADDMLAAPPYRLYIVRDMWYVSDERAQQIRNYVEKNNCSVLWLHGCGLLNERGIDPANCQRLTGIKTKLIDTVAAQHLTIRNLNHPATQHLTNVSVGLSAVDTSRNIAGPVLYADDPDAEILGVQEATHLPGFAFKSGRNRFDAWSAAGLLPHHIIANLATLAGVHRYVEPGNIIFGAGNVVSLQNDRADSIEFRAKNNIAAARDLLTAETYSAKNNVIRVPVIPGEPVLLKLC